VGWWHDPAVRIAVALASVGLVVVPACASDNAVLASAPPTSTTTSTTTPTSSTSTSSTTTTSTSTSTTTTATTLPPPIVVAPPPTRAVREQAWTPMLVTDGVTLHHPARIVERVGFHESNHDGARHLEAAATAVEPTVLDTRDRGTGRQTAADVVVDPALEIRAPVTGTVKRGGSYTLYCRHTDEYVVIVPDGADPAHWDVKVLHIVGLQVAAGDRVVAGETVLALHARQLPFESQVDELRTAEPAWPHVHIEAVDPTVADRPSPGGGC